ncbi:MAG: putative Acyl-CoA dehydrogenase [Frankiales bacterium]|nr:putative Acyl-CoA dehydrogenase [Frankiales bacterium]
MDLVPDEDDLALVSSIERFLARESSTAHLRDRLREGRPAQAATWAAVGALGAFSLGLSEADGGAGLSEVEEALVFRSLGRHLAPAAFIGSVVAARLAVLAGRADLVPDLAAGALPVAVTLPAVGGGSYAVCDLPAAALVLVDRGTELVLVAAAEVFGTELDPLDPATSLAVARLDDVVAEVAVGGADAARLRLLGTLLGAAMLVGIGEATRDEAVAYAKERVQFGKPIGSYQAIKHPCADMATRCEAAAALLFFAALALRDGRSDAAFQVAAAKRIATATAFDNARANVQIHGGTGVTWEHDAHLFVTRTHVLSRLFGDVPTQQRALLATAAAVP